MNAFQALIAIVAAVVSATVAVALHDIDAESYVAIVSAALGLAGGAGIHAAGVKAGAS